MCMNPPSLQIFDQVLLHTCILLATSVGVSRHYDYVGCFFDCPYPPLAQCTQASGAECTWSHTSPRTMITQQSPRCSYTAVGLQPQSYHHFGYSSFSLYITSTPPVYWTPLLSVTCSCGRPQLSRHNSPAPLILLLLLAYKWPCLWFLLVPPTADLHIVYV